ncbi:MAG: MGMT family protein [Pirellulaceae bacterium]
MILNAVAELSCVTAFNTDLGWIGLRFQGDRVGRLVFGHDQMGETISRLDAAEDLLDEPQLSAEQRRVVELLRAYAAGKGADLSQIEIDPGPATPFQRLVWQACREIPPGETLSYGQLAQVVGSPGAARAVGSCMAKNRIPLIIPCHRVIGSSGKLHGFSAPQGLTMKQRLLQLEGVGVAD